MKKKRMIRNFEAISKYDIYSKYNVELERQFKDRSLKSFVYNLKNKKTKERPQFLDEFYKKYPYEFEGKKTVENDIENFLKFDDSISVKEDKNSKLKANSPDNVKTELRCSFSTKKYDPNFPDPFKYNPNYNSIYKKVPSFKISPRKNEIINLKKKGIKEIYKNLSHLKTKKNLLYDINMTEEEKKIFKNKIKDINNINKITEVNNNSDINIDQVKLNKKENNLELPLITSTNIIKDLKKEKENTKNNRHNTIDTYSSRDNHALRFSKYLPRKIKFGVTCNQVSYIEPYNYNSDIKKTVDFSKMNSRNDKSIINVTSLDMPPIGKYDPKYTIVESNPKNVIFSPFGENKSNKKVILKKMLGSYNVFSEYKTIDNEKLFNDDDLIHKQLIINYNKNL